MKWVEQFIRCEDWKYRYAALMCLFAIIEVSLRTTHHTTPSGLLANRFTGLRTRVLAGPELRHASRRGPNAGSSPSRALCGLRLHRSALAQPEAGPCFEVSRASLLSLVHDSTSHTRSCNECNSRLCGHRARHSRPSTTASSFPPSCPPSMTSALTCRNDRAKHWYLLTHATHAHAPPHTDA